ncbi:MAG: CPBP family intramembrane glutamic endopeptidase [Ferruginibacter sp.]
MQYKSVKGFTGWAQLGFLFVFLGLGFILAGGIQLLLTLQMLPPGTKITDPDAVMKAILAPGNVNMARLMQALGTLFLLFIPAVLWSWVSNGKNMFWLGFSKYISGRQLILGFLIIFTAAFAAAPLADLSKWIVGHFPSLDATAKKMEEQYTQQALALSDLRGWGDYLIALVIMAFLPAMFEEVFFRGALQNLLVKWLRKPVVGILITSLIFSLIHLSVYLFLSRFVLGIALGLMFHLTKNIWITVIAHFLNNAIALSQLFFAAKTTGKKSLEQLEPHVHWSVGILSVAVLAGLFIFLKKYSVLNKARIEAKENFLIAAADPFRSFAEAENNYRGTE